MQRYAISFLALLMHSHSSTSMNTFDAGLWIFGALIGAALGLQLNCSTLRMDVCELNNVIITEYTDVSTWEFPDHHDLVFGIYPMSDESTMITAVTKEVAEKLTNAQTIAMQNVSLMSFYLWEHLLSLDVSYNYLPELIVNPDSTYHLKSLNLSHNRLQSINFLKGLYKLRDLDLSNNYLEKVDLSSFDVAKDLVTLKLSHNRIRTITTFTDLLHLPRLTTLMLNNNQLSILDASQWQFNVLQEMFLSNNRLSYISMCEIQNSFPRLQSLYLDGNNWECSNLNNTISQLHQYDVKLINYSAHNCTEAVENICCH
ncbi:oligodendrocyte-myelin glycoprotein-like [Topomyia yanbarensis]|uniref:oligodendrocyte-myelin glycoprotein-like n=1 Tax=Topomyia yanbarensis TaxID=2498891 RepID=UPI00273B89EC|nr:oligodendrocyte-myelin glycoprotein-like [Topomyia yanbarensis]